MNGGQNIGFHAGGLPLPGLSWPNSHLTAVRVQAQMFEDLTNHQNELISLESNALESLDGLSLSDFASAPLLVHHSILHLNLALVLLLSAAL